MVTMASDGAVASVARPRAASPPRSRGALSRQGPLVVHRGHHAQRRMPPDVVAVFYPARDRGPCLKAQDGKGQVTQADYHAGPLSVRTTAVADSA